MTTLDHIGFFVAEEGAARAALTALGFTVTPFSAQVVPNPETGEKRLTGTGNICVMLGHGYLEFLLKTADTELSREFSSTLDRRAGLHLLAFGTPDAARQHLLLEAGGEPVRPLARFSRPVETTDGEATASFTVARLERGAMAEGRVQFVTHHTPGVLWQPRWTSHTNGAMDLRAVVIAAPDPDEAIARYARLIGLPAEDRRLQLAYGAVEAISDTEAATLAGQAIDPGNPAFAGVRIGVRDLEAIRMRAVAAGLCCRDRRDGLAVSFPTALGRGFWLFEATSRG